MNTTMLKRNGVIAAAVVAVACLLALPGNAYAADIENTISSSKSSVSVGQSATLSCQTTYAMWGLGPLGVPFMSDWLTEIPYAYYSKPSVTSYTGSTNGGWEPSDRHSDIWFCLEAEDVSVVVLRKDGLERKVHHKGNGSVGLFQVTCAWANNTF